MNDMKKKIIRGVAVLAIAGAAGHFVQQGASSRKAPERAADALAAEPKNVETVAATDKPVASAPAATVAATVVATVVASAAKITLPPLGSLPENPPASIVPVMPAEPAAPAAPVVQAAATPSAAPAAVDCTPMLDLLSDDMAMIGVTLIAPCHGDQEFTLRHNGLVVVQRTNATGSFFAFLPALSRDGAVSISFKDGQELTGAVDVPALDGLRRVSLIWQAPDAFGIQALENGVPYGGAAAISVENPQTPAPGTLPTSGYLTRLGDQSQPGGLMAEVYTYPVTADTDTDAEVLFEAAVTPDSCGREVFAEVIQTAQGQAISEELVMTLPECDGESGFLVLNNPAQDQSIAALN